MLTRKFFPNSQDIEFSSQGFKIFKKGGIGLFHRLRALDNDGRGGLCRADGETHDDAVVVDPRHRAPAEAAAALHDEAVRPLLGAHAEGVQVYGDGMQPVALFEPQARGGKGVKAFYFNKSGSNGKYLAGLYLAGKGPCRLTIHQAQSPDTALNKDEIRLQSKTDRGVPYVMAVLEDVVTGLTGQEES